MAFAFDDSMIHQYWQQGYIVLRGIIPPALLRELRVEADKARAIAYERSGPQAQRTPKVEAMKDRINLKPFADYLEIPELVDVMERLFGKGTKPGGWQWLQILVEPKNRPRFGGWHRDGVCDTPVAQQQTPEVMAKHAENFHRPRSGNQVNCAIYTDSCLWYVPGSHLRVRDLPGEKQTYCFRTEKDPYASLDLSDIELERKFVDVCRAFPGAVQVHLRPGDYCLYRSQAWHCGLYVPTQPRATMHDIPVYEWSEGRGPASA